MSAERRRNDALREIERHRTSIAGALRRATEDVVDAEFEDIPRGKAHQEPDAVVRDGGDQASDAEDTWYDHAEDDDA